MSASGACLPAREKDSVTLRLGSMSPLRQPLHVRQRLWLQLLYKVVRLLLPPSLPWTLPLCRSFAKPAPLFPPTLPNLTLIRSHEFASS